MDHQRPGGKRPSRKHLPTYVPTLPTTRSAQCLKSCVATMVSQPCWRISADSNSPINTHVCRQFTQVKSIFSRNHCMKYSMYSTVHICTIMYLPRDQTAGILLTLPAPSPLPPLSFKIRHSFENAPISSLEAELLIFNIKRRYEAKLSDNLTQQVTTLSSTTKPSTINIGPASATKPSSPVSFNCDGNCNCHCNMHQPPGRIPAPQIKRSTATII